MAVYCAVMLLILGVGVSESQAGTIRIEPTAKQIGLLVVEGYPTRGKLTDNWTVPPDPNLMYDGSWQYLTWSFHWSEPHSRNEPKWQKGNDKNEFYGFKAIRVSDGDYIDAVPDELQYGINLFPVIQGAFARAIQVSSKSRNAILLNQNLPSDFNGKKLRDIVDEAMAANQLDGILVVNYTPMLTWGWPERRSDGPRPNGHHTRISVGYYGKGMTGDPSITSKSVVYNADQAKETDPESTQKKLDQQLRGLL